MQPARRILPIIVISQFCCTSVWFAGNAVLSDLMFSYDLPDRALGYLTSTVQLGFIGGTLVFAFLTVSDRFSPSKVFALSACFAAAFNVCIVWEYNTYASILALRFFAGFFLAGIYPVGMKIAADYYKEGLGKSLGFLVGALVLGTAFPHLLKSIGGSLPWKSVFAGTSVSALLGGLLMFVFVPDGPFRKKGQRLDLAAIAKVFANREFRQAAFGYFGHMWELYAFWAFVPVMLTAYQVNNRYDHSGVSVYSFVVIGTGGLACVLGGYLSGFWGVRRVAFLSLLLSCFCCLLSPLMFQLSPIMFYVFLIFWGMVVVADSPMFSTLVANSATGEIKGTSLTLTNCIGFSITIFSIQLLNGLTQWTDSVFIYTLLAIGPILGLIALSRKERIQNPNGST